MQNVRSITLTIKKNMQLSIEQRERKNVKQAPSTTNTKGAKETEVLLLKINKTEELDNE